ncbi:MAG TPA: MerR family transcriptional regulator [Nocardioides sp.]|uniref:MerR family transcriptional regulator n=1 Tax=uncultured Nocardioides sp. TaxID=198441 RepID=UPI000EDFF188|nr:MerR family transcriptional regulator [uncultured Nocardioides sp.]HCB06960.1 MerR family transcriptional regulator [Nocardioides sp.]HRD60850.1 MerR family transcriptional regulator [Nocardioides sp.]HRI96338.1 MerR family transcriptional regulator [Nocardioides sp.]HRK46973.1 MerR family transcriptional regulator [Nocardioides sp.]
MLTIGQLAAYAGVTVRAVRHYHQIGLLPEPERDSSGYRSYDAAAVVRLIRIRTLAEAGVPLSRVQELLDAAPEEFAAAVDQIDQELRAEVRRLQEHRRRIARLAAGDSLALPRSVVDYLDRLREAGVPAAAIEPERDAWILVAARWPDAIDEMMVDKVRQLDDPRLLRFYGVMGALADGEAGDDVLVEAADLMAEMVEEAAARGELDQFGEEFGDRAFVTLLDTFAHDAHPLVERLQELMRERGWAGWTRLEKLAE